MRHAYSGRARRCRCTRPGGWWASTPSCSRPRGVVYGVASRRVFDTVRAMMPVLEQLSYDEAFGEPAELAGASAADVGRFCEELRGRVREETGLVASVGAGSGKQIAKIGSELAKPDGIRVIRRDEEQALLAGLPVRRLWGIGPVAEEKLHRLGIQTIGQLAELTDAEAADILGATVGPALHRLARGIDDRPVAERAEAKQISAESTFPADLTTHGAAAAGGRPDRRARASAADQGRPRCAHGDRQAQALRHEHADPVTDPAVRHRRPGDVDRGRPPVAARPTRDRSDSACRRWLLGSDARFGRSHCFPTWTRGISRPTRRPRPQHRQRPSAVGASVTTSTTASGATAGCRAPATG